MKTQLTSLILAGFLILGALPSCVTRMNAQRTPANLSEEQKDFEAKKFERSVMRGEDRIRP